MRHASVLPRSDAMRRFALAGLAVVVFAALPAAAQIGMPRRVRDAVVQPPTDTVQVKCRAVVLDTLIIELTTARVDQVIKGMRAGRGVLNGRPGVLGWDALGSRRDVAMAEVGTLSERHSEAIAAHTQRQTAIDQCREVAFADLRQANLQQTMNRMMSDPALAMKYSELTQRMMDAQQRGDSAAMMRIKAEVDALTAFTRDDSLAVDRKCGRALGPHPIGARIDSLRAAADTFTAQQRRLEEQAHIAGARASGLTPGQMAMGRERAEMYLAWSKTTDESAICGFTKVELAALKARRAELVELL